MVIAAAPAYLPPSTARRSPSPGRPATRPNSTTISSTPCSGAWPRRSPPAIHVLDHSAALLGELVVRARPDRAVRRRGHRARHRQSAGDVEVLARLLWCCVRWRGDRGARPTEVWSRRNSSGCKPARQPKNSTRPSVRASTAASPKSRTRCRGGGGRRAGTPDLVCLAGAARTTIATVHSALVVVATRSGV